MSGLGGDLYDSLLVYLHDENIDVACFQETRWGFTSTWHAQGYFCFHSGLSNNSTKRSGEAGGVLTMVKTSLSPLSMLRWCPNVSGRLLHVRFLTQGLRIQTASEVSEIASAKTASAIVSVLTMCGRY